MSNVTELVPPIRTKGLDVSHWQARATFTAAAIKGFNPQFLVAKATEGTDFKDPAFRDNLRLAQSINVPVLGAYHYLRHGNVARQLDNFMSQVANPTGMMIQLDIEHGSVMPKDVEEYIRLWNNRTSDYPLFIYTGDWFWTSRRFGDPKLSTLAPLWAAPNRGYPGNNFRESDWIAGYGGWKKLAIAQYGVNKAIGDMNYYAGTLNELIARHTRGHEGHPVVPDNNEHIYLTRSYDSLRSVSDLTLGTETQWQTILHANEELLREWWKTAQDSDSYLDEGITLVIPEISPLPAPAPTTRKYTVMKGDNLSKLARRFYNDPNKWRWIFNANRANIKDPNLIHPGQVLIIP